MPPYRARRLWSISLINFFYKPSKYVYPRWDRWWSAASEGCHHIDVGGCGPKLRRMIASPQMASPLFYSDSDMMMMMLDESELILVSESRVDRSCKF